MTPPRNQEKCGSCTVFAMTGVVEALANLYFNQNINLDLSEQQIMACEDGNCKNGWNPYYVAKYYKDGWVATEKFMPYVATDTIECPFNYSSSQFLVSAYGFERYEKERQEDSIKRLIIKYGPICAGIGSIGHAMTLLGFGTIKAGDKIDILDGSGSIIIPNNHPDIGKTYWIFKNSYGKTWGENGGFAYAIIDLKKASIIHINTPIDFKKISTPNIVCEDRDGDGYYYWGIGKKPETCPNCPDEPDGDDSNPALGPMDEYGNCREIKKDLIIRDDKEDTGIEPNPQAIQWNSPDIWLVDDNYNPIPITELDNYSSCHIAVRIKNVGNTTTTGKERLSVYWSKSAYKSKWKASWSGSNIYQRLFGLPKGDEISPEDGFILSTPLQPNEERIYYFPFNIPEKLTTQRKEIDSKIAELIKMKIPMSWGFAILAKINDGNDIDGENGMMINTTTFAQNSNNVAVNNGGLLIFKDRLTRMVIIDDLIQQPVSFDFNQLPTKDNFTLSDFAEIGVALSQDLMNKIIVDKCKNVRIIKNKNIVLLTSPNARLSFAPLNSNSEIYFIGLTVNFISDIMPELNEFDIDVILSTENDSEIKRFTAIRDEHVYFKAHAGASKTVVVKAKESVTLTSNIISDEATYIWYDEAGNVIGEESKISVTPDISQTYTVEIEKVTDGYKSYDSIRVEVVEGMINNLSPNPARDEVKIEYSLSDNVQSASIQISDMQNIVVLTYPVQVSETQRMIPLGSLTPGVYFLKLLIDGQTIDSKQLIINQ